MKQIEERIEALRKNGRKFKKSTKRYLRHVERRLAKRLVMEVEGG